MGIVWRMCGRSLDAVIHVLVRVQHITTLGRMHTGARFSGSAMRLSGGLIDQED